MGPSNVPGAFWECKRKTKDETQLPRSPESWGETGKGAGLTAPRPWQQHREPSGGRVRVAARREGGPLGGWGQVPGLLYRPQDAASVRKMSVFLLSDPNMHLGVRWVQAPQCARVRATGTNTCVWLPRAPGSPAYQRSRGRAGGGPREDERPTWLRTLRGEGEGQRESCLWLQRQGCAEDPRVRCHHPAAQRGRHPN